MPTTDSDLNNAAARMRTEAIAAPLVHAEDLSLARRVCAFGLILLGYVFYSYAWNTVDILRPYIRQSSGLSLQEAGLLYSAQSLGALIGAPIIGQLADRFGRRLLLTIITLGYALSLLGGLAVHGLWALLAQRLVLGLFVGGVFSVVVGLYMGLFDQRLRGRLASLVGAMFSAGIVLQGWLGTFLLERDWTLMLWAGGLPPLLIAALSWWVIPDDRRVIPHGAKPAPAAGRSNAAATAMATTSSVAPVPAVIKPHKLPIAELFKPAVRRVTLLLTLMSGLNFFANQAFVGWVTTYLKDERGLAGAGIGALVAWQGVGGILGGFVWGWIADRYGRRMGSIGFFLGGAMIVAYLRAPSDLTLLTVLGFAFGFIIASGVVWGPFFAELYPPHLRSTAASIIHWGRIIAFFAPAVTAGVASVVGLTTSMMLAALLYCAAGGIWLMLPETLVRKALKV